MNEIILTINQISFLKDILKREQNALDTEDSMEFGPDLTEILDQVTKLKPTVFESEMDTLKFLLESILEEEYNYISDYYNDNLSICALHKDDSVGLMVTIKVEIPDEKAIEEFKEHHGELKELTNNTKNKVTKIIDKKIKESSGVCTVLDFSTEEIHIHQIDALLQIEEIEKILIEKYDYNLSNIQFMITKSLDLTIDKHEDAIV